MTDNAVQAGIVRRYRTIQIYPERFSYIRSVVSSINLRLCRQSLRLDVQAEIAKLIVALIAYGEVNFIARADLEPPAVMIVAGRPSSYDIHRVRESVIHRILMQAHNLAIEIPVRACWIGHVWVQSFLLVNIRVCDVDIIVARALQQFRVQCHTQKSVLTAWGGNLPMVTATRRSRLSYAVAHRTQEMGIRLALGTTPGHPRAKFIVEGLATVVIGTVGGVLCAGASGKLLANLMTGAEALTVPAYILAANSICAVAAASIWVATRRLAHLDVVEILRAE